MPHGQTGCRCLPPYSQGIRCKGAMAPLPGPLPLQRTCNAVGLPRCRCSRCWQGAGWGGLRRHRSLRRWSRPICGPMALAVHTGARNSHCGTRRRRRVRRRMGRAARRHRRVPQGRARQHLCSRHLSLRRTWWGCCGWRGHDRHPLHRGGGGLPRAWLAHLFFHPHRQQRRMQNQGQRHGHPQAPAAQATPQAEPQRLRPRAGRRFPPHRAAPTPAGRPAGTAGIRRWPKASRSAHP